jgi:S1-C subfamily serine protease
VDTVNRVVPELIRTGRYTRPVIGIGIDEGINRRIVDALQVEGVYVLRVAPGSAAEQAGLRSATLAEDGSFVPGDIIVGIEGRKVSAVAELLGRLDDYEVGDTVRLEVRRDGATVTVPVILQPGA